MAASKLQIVGQKTFSELVSAKTIHNVVVKSTEYGLIITFNVGVGQDQQRVFGTTRGKTRYFKSINSVHEVLLQNGIVKFNTDISAELAPKAGA